MDLKTLYQEVLTNFKKNGMELHTRLDDVGDFVFAYMGGKYNYSHSVLDQKLIEVINAIRMCVMGEGSFRRRVPRKNVRFHYISEKLLYI